MINQGAISLNEQLNRAVENYLNYERISEHRLYIQKLIGEKNQDELKRLVCNRLTFGTAGIRGCMGAGYGQMNDLVIIQTTQGLVSYLLEVDPKSIRRRGVVIGHDARHNSARFSRLTALAFLQKDIPVHYSDHIMPTPFVAFGVKHYNCFAGIMITASHNPKMDNGYKVYWSNGAQILSPHDKNIQEHIVKEENLKPWAKAWDHELLCPSLVSDHTSSDSSVSKGTTTPEQVRFWADNLLMRIHGDLSKAYFLYIEDLVGERRQDNQTSNICITFTAMHGVGHMYISRALDVAGFDDIFPVESQKKPDPEFSTVKFPNPEEAGALDLAFETAKHANSNLILANDPDSDRCAAALYNPTTGYRCVLNGNEIGALLGWWIWHCYTTPTQEDSRTLSEKDDEHLPEPSTFKIKHKPSDCYMISTAVSSKFLQSMANIEGFKFRETLTGFKHMGNLADQLIGSGKHVLFAYEEAIGYMVNSTILDKDGVSASVQVAQCAAYVSKYCQRTLEEQLDWLYAIYGYHYSLNSYYICSESAIIDQIFNNLQKNYPSSFGTGKEFLVTRVRDLNNGYDSATTDKKATLPISSSSYMLTFFVNQDIQLTIRTSGTEPKIKYYSEIVAQLPNVETLEDESRVAAKEAARQKLQRLVEYAVELCLKPQHYGLESAMNASD